MRNAKIVYTLGPATESIEQVPALAEAGMSIARLNASHGSPEHRRAMIDRIRDVDDAVDSSVASMLDMPGPEVRTAPLDDAIRLEAGTTVRFAVGTDATPAAIGLSRPIVASTPNERVRRRLALSWGTTPLHTELTDDGVDTVIEGAVQSAFDAGIVESGDTVVFCGMMTEPGVERTTNTMKVHVVP